MEPSQPTKNQPAESFSGRSPLAEALLPSRGKLLVDLFPGALGKLRQRAASLTAMRPTRGSFKSALERTALVEAQAAQFKEDFKDERVRHPNPQFGLIHKSINFVVALHQLERLRALLVEEFPTKRAALGRAAENIRAPEVTAHWNEVARAYGELLLVASRSSNSVREVKPKLTATLRAPLGAKKGDQTFFSVNATYFNNWRIESLGALTADDWSQLLISAVRTNAILAASPKKAAGGNVSGGELVTKMFQLANTPETQRLSSLDGQLLVSDLLFRGKLGSTVQNRPSQAMGWESLTMPTHKVRQIKNQVSTDAQFFNTLIGKNGYVAFADTYCAGDMRAPYMAVSAILTSVNEPGKTMKELGWQAFAGSTKEFGSLSAELSKNFSRWSGITGYLDFADQHCKGEMVKAFLKVSAVLAINNELHKSVTELDWQGFNGTTKRFRQLATYVSDNFSELHGSGAQIKFANVRCGSSMQKAFTQMSAILNANNERNKTIEALEWTGFIGSTAEFKRVSSEFQECSVYRGTDGCMKFADENCGGDMHKAYRQASAVLAAQSRGAKSAEDLGWSHFRGSTADFKTLMAVVQQRFSEFSDSAGYVKFANAYFVGDMGKAYRNMSAILSALNEPRRTMVELDWQHFAGSTAQFESLSGNVLRNFSTLAGMTGYTEFADRVCSGDMLVAYLRLSSVLSLVREPGKTMKSLQWQSFPGSTTEFKTYSKELSRDFLSYVGKVGHVAFADSFCSGDMGKAFICVNAIASMSNDSEKAAAKLGWVKCTGSTADFQTLSKTVSEQFTQLQGVASYLAFANKYFNEDMQLAFAQVSAALSYNSEPDKTLAKLDWMQFSGLTRDYRALSPEIREKFSTFAGVGGYVKFADTYCGGEMQRAYNHVSFILSAFNEPGKSMTVLGWQQFLGSTKRFEFLTQQIDQHFAKMSGPTGLQWFANEYCADDTVRAYKQVSAISHMSENGESKMKQLGWKKPR